MDFKNMIAQAKIVRKRCGRPVLFTLIDMTYCGFKYSHRCRNGGEGFREGGSCYWNRRAYNKFCGFKGKGIRRGTDRSLNT